MKDSLGGGSNGHSVALANVTSGGKRVDTESGPGVLFSDASISGEELFARVMKDEKKCFCRRAIVWGVMFNCISR